MYGNPEIYMCTMEAQIQVAIGNGLPLILSIYIPPAVYIYASEIRSRRCQYYIYNTV